MKRQIHCVLKWNVNKLRNGNAFEIILVRHGLSAGNKDKKVHHDLPDHAIPLAEEGFEQARKVGLLIQEHLFRKIDHGHVRLWQSPYLRTRQTAEEIVKTQWPNGKSIITDVREDVALCEQQFGLFDGLSDKELKERYPNEHAHYEKCERFDGRFWARMPLGESRFDVTLRVHQMFGTWIRDADQHGITTIVVVSHGVTIRAILMRWLHHSFEWFENEPNPGNCSFRVISACKDIGYIHNE